MDQPSRTIEHQECSAWERARQYGIDLSLLEINLTKTPLERIRQHQRALNAALALREAMEKRHD